MTPFAELVDDYLRLRRALEFKLEEHARLLPKFAAHLDAIGAEVVTIDVALGWAVQPIVPAGSVVPAMRLLVVRGFARYLAGIDPRTEVPPTGLIGLRRHRRPPFIYTDEQVLALMERARTAIRQRLVAATYDGRVPSGRRHRAAGSPCQCRPCLDASPSGRGRLSGGSTRSTTNATAAEPFLGSQPQDMRPDLVIPDVWPRDEKLWVPLSEGVWSRPLHFNVTAGQYTHLMRVTRAGIIARHRRTGPVFAHIFKGRWHYLEHDWVAEEGGFAFEPPGETHTLVVPEGCAEMVTLFQVNGALVYVDQQGGAMGYDRRVHALGGHAPALRVRGRRRGVPGHAHPVIRGSCSPCTAGARW
jgi:2,4'-dihydroxyacetophenone dioxygenase